MSETFLTQEEVAELTGRVVRAKQIEALRKMAIAFWVNAAGRPVVPRRVIDGSKPAIPEKKKWVPKVLQAG